GAMEVLRSLRVQQKSLRYTDRRVEDRGEVRLAQVCPPGGDVDGCGAPWRGRWDGLDDELLDPGRLHGRQVDHAQQLPVVRGDGPCHVSRGGGGDNRAGGKRRPQRPYVGDEPFELLTAFDEGAVEVDVVGEDLRGEF